MLAIIPARGGSKGIPRKNIKLLAGKPLLYYILTAALGSKLLTHVVVSSDDAEILSVAERYGGKKVCLQRSGNLAEDDTPDLPVFIHALESMEKINNCRYDYVVMLHTTSPLITSVDIDGTLEKLFTTGADSAVSVYEVNDFHPKKLMKIKDGKLAPYVAEFAELTTSRRQDVQPVYKRNGGIYASKRYVVTELGRVWGDHVVPYIMPDTASVDINSQVDFILAEALMQKRSDETGSKANS